MGKKETEAGELPEANGPVSLKFTVGNNRFVTNNGESRSWLWLFSDFHTHTVACSHLTCSHTGPHAYMYTYVLCACTHTSHARLKIVKVVNFMLCVFYFN